VKKYLGWQAKVLPKEGVTNSINWIQKNKDLFEVIQ